MSKEGLREKYAGLAMAALISNPVALGNLTSKADHAKVFTGDLVAKQAVRQADSLIAALEKPEKK